MGSDGMDHGRDDHRSGASLLAVLCDRVDSVGVCDCETVRVMLMAISS